MHTLYFDEMCYQCGIALTKLSVLFFYRRIFTVTPGFKMTLAVTGIFVILWWLGGLLAVIFSCIPVQGFWDHSIAAKCEYQFGFFIGQAVPNIILDFVLLLLPLRSLLSLRMRRQQKMALLGVFLLGYLNPVVSIFRIVSFIQLGPDTAVDPNYALTVPALWSTAEVAVAIVSSSIPGMTYLFRRLLHIGGDSTQYGSKGSNKQAYLRRQSAAVKSALVSGAGGLDQNAQSSRSDSAQLIPPPEVALSRGRDSHSPYPLQDIHVRSEVNVEYS